MKRGDFVGGRMQRSWTAVLTLAVAAALAVVSGATAAELAASPQVFALEPHRTLGSSEAPVTMVEFSDFQCSFCRKFWAETLPRLKQTYVQNGRVRFAYQHFAVLGEPSVAAAQAAECAGEQGRFWPYHDKLFENQGGSAFADSKLKRYALELGLDAAAFARCLDSRRHQQKIEDETRLGFQSGARGTPTFFLNGRLLVGAQPFEVFQAAIEEALAKAPGPHPDRERSNPTRQLPRR